jgi:hypothetical protein
VNSYKLNNKDQDQHFLGGNPVKGSAVFRKSEFKPDVIKPGERIVIQLSTGKKYLGKVAGFIYEIKGEIIEGEIDIIRV